MFHNKKMVALCTSRIYDTEIHSFIEKLNESLRAQDCALLIFAINSDIYWEEDNISAEASVFDTIPYPYLDAIVIMDEKIKSHTVSNRIIENARVNNVPVITLDGDYPDIPNIGFDFKAGFELIVRHLFEEHKVRKPHMMAGIPNNPFSDDRIEIFKKLCAEFEIPVTDNMISYGEFWAVPCKEAMLKVLERGDEFDAVICANDIMAISVCDVLSNAGIRVPEDVLVSGFDGSKEIYFTTPMITTADCDILLMADETAKAIQTIVNGGEYKGSLITPKLVPNESCGCPAVSISSQSLLNLFYNSFYRHQDDMRELYTVAAQMASAGNIDEMVLKLVHYHTHDILCTVSKECFETDENYFSKPMPENWARTLTVIYDSEYPPSVDQSFQSIKKTMTFDRRLQEILESGYPLICNALDYMNKPLGFVCYHFDDYLITNYSRTASITSAISLGIGGYINRAYQEALADKMNEMYKRDALTGLYNRVAFQNIFRDMRYDKQNQNKPITVVMSDLDGLKYINDHFGHADGDNAIAMVAKALLDACPTQAVCARFGGDEVFCVIIGSCNPEGIIGKINKVLDDFNKDSGLAYFVTTSSGAYTTVLDEEFDILQALKVADEKMYEVKKAKNLSR